MCFFTELQELGTDITAVELARDTVKFRWLLDIMLGYEDSLLLGPDVTRLKTTEDIVFLKNFFSEAEAVLSGITWHP